MRSHDSMVCNSSVLQLITTWIIMRHKRALYTRIEWENIGQPVWLVVRSQIAILLSSIFNSAQWNIHIHISRYTYKTMCSLYSMCKILVHLFNGLCVFNYTHNYRIVELSKFYPPPWCITLFGYTQNLKFILLIKFGILCLCISRLWVRM